MQKKSELKALQRQLIDFQLRHQGEAKAWMSSAKKTQTESTRTHLSNRGRIERTRTNSNELERTRKNSIMSKRPYQRISVRFDLHHSGVQLNGVGWRLIWCLFRNSGIGYPLAFFSRFSFASWNVKRESPKIKTLDWALFVA